MTDWQITKKTLNERCLFLFESGQWHDCEFIVGMESNQQVFQAHRLVLTMASPVFEAMLFGGMAEKAPIKVLDVSPEAFRSLMLYIYSDQINLQSFDQACEICYAAKKYMLPHLVEHCTKFLWKDLEPHNVCRAYEFAKLFEEPVLMEKCMKIITQQTAKVIATSAIEDVEHASLIAILEQDYLNITSELDIFNVLVRWSRKECQRRPLEVNAVNQRMVLGDALYRVRYLTMNATTFANGPAVSGLLSPEESLAIVMNILTPGKWPLPDHLDGSTLPRGACPPAPAAAADSQLPGGSRRLCARPILGEPHQLIRCQEEASLTLSVDRPVHTLGIMVPSQVTDIPTDWLPSQSLRNTPGANLNYGQNGYMELLYAYVADSDNQRLTYTHFTSRVNYNDLVEILFNRPVLMQPGRVYRIGLVLNKLGWYPMGVSTTQVHASGVTFSFGIGKPGDNVKNGLVRKIVFSTDGVPDL
ncbi:BTB/POZ domain-containing protein 2 [Amphibalanus amphitrite]|uniref:BTB/POZ domain-containing protein 2 n=1 Tax=Amphibalanus amphitrite TaxID=1232801 RepID=A0A6A4W628_AMPAM|nr:BTB/POZ domain-containing protein 2-like [Amphibalanus amphitrite]XP_043213300.1 BTB/POZ domain-containing protein 2-like [Amphibalanus amphitrite]XP_043213310.1 BTB/POZ domain-containing protein 2-like [Amphibalanus amphitrite]KAF0298472.1 BTB/POZ domain-containing protein 2 [Amphibalanus amphitrite]